MPTTTLVILSDPNAGEEAFGRVFNALAAAHEHKTRGVPVRVVFQGTGTRWIAALAKPEHPAHGLYRAVEDTILGASLGCATTFGARADVEAAGVPFLTNNPVPGTPGLPSLVDYVGDGPVLTF